MQLIAKLILCIYPDFPLPDHRSYIIQNLLIFNLFIKTKFIAMHNNVVILLPELVVEHYASVHILI